MIYCVSDIHGELDKFERLLALIQFSKTTTCMLSVMPSTGAPWVWTSCGWSWIRLI